jgi:hypothetical protein
MLFQKGKHMGRPKTIPFEKEKFRYGSYTAYSIDYFENCGYKLKVSKDGRLYATKGREFRLIGEVCEKPGYNPFKCVRKKHETKELQ